MLGGLFEVENLTRLSFATASANLISDFLDGSRNLIEVVANVRLSKCCWDIHAVFWRVIRLLTLQIWRQKLIQALCRFQTIFAGLYLPVTSKDSFRILILSKCRVYIWLYLR